MSGAGADEGRFQLEWTPHGPVKAVVITNTITGDRFTGRDWASWDVAYKIAIHQARSGARSRARAQTPPSL